MGLDRTAIYGLSIVQTEGYQKTLSMCFHMENFATLCRGIPSTFRRSKELSESLLYLNDVSGLTQPGLSQTLVEANHDL
jgi:hypothetical protein